MGVTLGSVGAAWHRGQNSWGQRLVADGDAPPHVDRVLSE